MGLVVSAQVLRELIMDGEYLVECIEQQARGKIAVAFALRSRTQPYSIQIETMDNKLTTLFRALAHEKPLRDENLAAMKIGSQPIPVVEVNSIPADTSTGRRRGTRRIIGTDVSSAREPSKPAARSRRSTRQLVLVPSEKTDEPAARPNRSRRRRTAGAGEHRESH